MSEGKMVSGFDCVPNGCVAIPRQLNQLQLDLDSDAAYLTYIERWQKVEAHLGVPEDVTEWKSRHGNRHVVITFDDSLELSASQAIAIQSFLGSDPVREFLSLRRDMALIEEPIMLFRPVETIQDAAV